MLCAMKADTNVKQELFRQLVCVASGSTMQDCEREGQFGKSMVGKLTVLTNCNAKCKAWKKQLHRPQPIGADNCRRPESDSSTLI